MALTRPKAAQVNFDVTNVTDPLIRLNSGQSGTNDKDVGIVIERGSDTNVGIIWDESADQVAIVNTTDDGTTHGNVTIGSYADIRANAFYGDGSNLTGIASAYGDSDVASYLSTNGYDTSSNIVASITDSAPATLDTLNELAAALGDDANFSTTVTNSIATKLPLAGGTMSGDIVFNSTQLFDGRDVSADGTKLDGIESGATADQTAGEILAAIKTVDGPDSGLDADTIDGNHSSAFATAAQGTLANSAVQPGDNVSDLTNDSGYLTSNQQITFTDDITFNTGVIQSNSKLDSAAETLSTTAETAIYAFPYSVYGSAEFLVTALNGSNRHITKILVVHNGTTAFATEYGSVFSSNELASYDVLITGSNVTLFATPVSSDTIFKIATTLIE